jgi:hypothetical protein
LIFNLQGNEYKVDDLIGVCIGLTGFNHVKGTEFRILYL